MNRKDNIFEIYQIEKLDHIGRQAGILLTTREPLPKP
jgi:hypothetical protein